MTMSDAPTKSTPSHQIHAFLKGLPSPFKEQLLHRLYAFFEGDVITAYAIEMEPENALEFIVFQSEEYQAFQRAVIVIGALDYLFSQKEPWSTLVEGHASIEISGLTCSAFRPISDVSYLEARAQWKKIRSKLSYFLLRKLDEKVSKSYQQEQNQLASDQ